MANAIAKVATRGAKARQVSEQAIVANELRKAERRAAKAQQAREIAAVEPADGGVTYRDRLREQVAAANGSDVPMERVIARKRVAYQLLHGTLTLRQIERVIKALSPKA